jgi:hypothetical protein
LVLFSFPLSQCLGDTYAFKFLPALKVSCAWRGAEDDALSEALHAHTAHIPIPCSYSSLRHQFFLGLLVPFVEAATLYSQRAVNGKIETANEQL